MPLRPDLVIYYEGGNQFRPASVVPSLANKALPAPPPPAPVPALSWLQVAAKYSALVARIQAAVGIAGTAAADGREPAKPDYQVVWPAGLDELDPDLAYPNLPVTLNVIQRDLDQMRTDLAKVGSDFAVSSFLWMVKDGLVLDPVRHRYIYEQLNTGNYPFRYRDMERLSNFQNRFLEKYARVHGLPFIDFAKYMPLDPDLFIDAVHTNYAGLRLQAWAGFNLLLPIVEKHLADKSWPRPSDPRRRRCPPSRRAGSPSPASRKPGTNATADEEHEAADRRAERRQGEARPVAAEGIAQEAQQCRPEGRRELDDRGALP